MYRYYGKTDRGMRRIKNEDAYLVEMQSACMRGEERHYLLAIVADGLGGHSAGDVASKDGVKYISVLTFIQIAEAEYLDEEELKKILEKAMRLSHKKIKARGEEIKYWRMGTTATVCLFYGEKVYIAHAGDCRVYLLEKQELRQLTEDHTIAWVLYKHGEISKEEIRTHPMRSRLTNHLGIYEGELKVDWIEQAVKPGMRFLVCSDGLYDMLSDAEINEVLMKVEDCKACCEEFVKKANEKGGEDNITAVVVDIV